MAAFHALRRWLAHRIYPEGVWNADLSLEVDRLTLEVERLRAELADCRGGGAR